MWSRWTKSLIGVQWTFYHFNTTSGDSLITEAVQHLMLRYLLLQVIEEAVMKLLQIVWNFPDTVMRPFEMYYFYWPVREAVLRGWEAEVLTFQVDNQQPAEEIIDGIRVRRCPAGVRKGRPFVMAIYSRAAHN